MTAVTPDCAECPEDAELSRARQAAGQVRASVHVGELAGPEATGKVRNAQLAPGPARFETAPPGDPASPKLSPAAGLIDAAGRGILQKIDGLGTAVVRWFGERTERAQELAEAQVAAGLRRGRLRLRVAVVSACVVATGALGAWAAAGATSGGNGWISDPGASNVELASVSSPASSAATPPDSGSAVTPGASKPVPAPPATGRQ